jgi:glycosyltransferase involved in cell wall biosynthesis
MVHVNQVCGSRSVVKSKYNQFIDGGLRKRGKFKSNSNSELPLVSIITVCLNSADTIRECIRSVQAQSYANIEYIIIDGASNDGTLKVLHEFEDIIDYYASEPDTGLYDAMNKGLSLAVGKYITLLNSDDWYTSDCIQSLIDAINKEKVDFVSGFANYVDQNNNIQYCTGLTPLDKTTHIRNPLRHETMLVSADIYNQYGPYSESYKVISDFHFIIKLYEAKLSHFTIERPLMGFRNTGVSSTDMTSLVSERQRILQEQFPYVLKSDITIISDLSKLQMSDIGGLLNRNRMYHKFHASLLAFSMTRWKWGANFLVKHDTNKYRKDFIRVETFATNASGGAGIGSQRRIKALKSIGISVGYNAAIYDKTDPDLEPLCTELGDNQAISTKLIADRAFVNRRNTPKFSADEMFSGHTSILRMTNMLPAVNRADVLHFHWMSGILDYERFDIIADKPIVWTLADMAAFTGGCHYSQGCEGYKSNCSNCPVIGGDQSIVSRTWEIKKIGYSKLNNVTIICPSQWLADKARESTLFTNFKVVVIPNPVPFSTYFPVNKTVAKIRLGLDPARKYMLFGAESVTNKRKGGDLLAASLKILNNTTDHDFDVLTFGSQKLELPYEQHQMGFCSDEDKLRLIYSAADVFAFPSRADNSPLTVSEAMACGTPIVSFPVGNVPDLVVHKKNGYIAKYGDTNDFSEGLSWFMSQTAKANFSSSLSAIASIRSNNDPVSSAHMHEALYREVIG